MNKSTRPSIIRNLKPFDLAKHLAEEAAADNAEMARIKAEVATPEWQAEFAKLRPDGAAYKASKA